MRDRVTEQDINHLLIQLKNGDEDTLTILMTHFIPRFRARGVNRYHLSLEDADEVAQQTFVHAYCGIQTYRPGGGSKWLWALFTNIVIDLLRRQKKQRDTLVAQGINIEELTDEHIENLLIDESVCWDPEKYVEYREVIDTIIQALKLLPETDRQEIYNVIINKKPKRGRKTASDREAPYRLRAAQDRLRFFFKRLYHE